jgi:imidazolonepropionase-like amidohydrolase
MHAGKLADLIAVRGNPLADVKTVQQVLWMMKAGVVVKQAGKEVSREGGKQGRR